MNFFVFVSLCSILGMHLFGCKFSLRTENGDTIPDRKNFDSLLWAIVTVFQVGRFCLFFPSCSLLRHIRPVAHTPSWRGAGATSAVEHRALWTVPIGFVFYREMLKRHFIPTGLSCEGVMLAALALHVSGKKLIGCTNLLCALRLIHTHTHKL